MRLGEKIKTARLKLKLTQSDLVGDKITRNMLSAIESGKATPSLDTLEYLAERLDLPLPFLLSYDDDLLFYRKKERILAIKNALDEKNYNVCINLVLKLEGLDDELAYILSDCYFNLGVNSLKYGSLESSAKYLGLCLNYCERTIYDTKRFRAIAPLYLAIAKNVSAPLLEFEADKYYAYLKEVTDLEFYKYLILDASYPYTRYEFASHIKAKSFIKERKYREAVEILLEIENKKGEFEYNSYLMFGVYTDLDNCYRQLFDFENAYRYASKRISLLEGFKS